MGSIASDPGVVARRDDRTVLELAGPDGAPVKVALDVGRDEVRDVVRLVERRDLRSGILICQHLPGSRDGRDLYELTRAVQTGHWYAIAAASFPTDRIPPEWVASLNALQEVWVPGAFNRETFARSGVDRGRIHVVPLRFHTLARPAEPARAYALQTERSFRFLSVLRLEERKGWRILLRAYLDAFGPADDVALVLRVPPEPGQDDPRVAEAILARVAAAIEETGRGLDAIPEIALVPEKLSRPEVAALMAQCDAFVLPSRGEAWCQPMFEAFAMGLPVVTTRIGGPLAYLNDRNSFLVGVEALADVPEEVTNRLPLFRGHRWADPRADAVAREMRRVFDDREEAKRRAAQAVSDAGARWTAQHAVARMAARVLAIEEESRGAAPATAARCPSRTRAPARVLWRAAVFDQSGYASEARAYVKGLQERGLDCKVSPLVWSSRVASLGLADRLLLHQLCELPLADRHVSVQHHFPPQFQRTKAAPVAIGRTMFETDRIPAAWVAPCNAMDEIWVPSTQNVESFSASGVDANKLVVVPGTFDFTSYTREGPRHPAIAPGRFTFLTVFDWHLRKGWDILLRAYAEAFAGRDDVQLAMKLQLSNGMSMETAAKLVRNAMARHLRGRAAPPVQLIGKLPEGDLPALYRAADVFVLPTRGEGYGRPFAEAMAVGVPAIGTRWSGQVDFMDDANSWLIDCHLVAVSEEALREVPTFRGHRWAEPSAHHLRRLMIEAVESPGLVAAKGRRAEVDVRAKLSPDRVLGIIRSRLDHWLARL